MKKFTLIGFLVVATIAGSLLWRQFTYPSDNRIRQRILGAWKVGEDTTEINPDGSYVREFMLSVKDDPDLGGKEMTEKGTWEVKDGFFLTMITNEPWPNASHNVTRKKVVKIVDHKMVLRYESGGMTNTLVFRKE